MPREEDARPAAQHWARISRPVEDEKPARIAPPGAARAEFSAALRELRAAGGFPSAWAFYKSRGPRALGCTYKAYQYLEKGRSVPQPRLALRIAAGLGVFGEPGKQRRFVSSYLRSLLERPELAEFLVRTLSASPDSRGMSDLFQRASRLIYTGRSIAVTQRQAEVLLSDWAVYWSWLMLSDDKERRSAAQAAKTLEIPEPRARAALRAIVRAGLLEEDAQGRFYCPNAGMSFNFPRDAFYLPRFREAVERAWGEMAKRRGAVLFDRYYMTRASEADVRNYFPHLAQMAQGTRVYAATEKGPDTAFIAVKARVRRLMPF